MITTCTTNMPRTAGVHSQLRRHPNYYKSVVSGELHGLHKIGDRETLDEAAKDMRRHRSENRVSFAVNEDGSLAVPMG